MKSRKTLRTIYIAAAAAAARSIERDVQHTLKVVVERER
jgi:hypothetical protein